MAAPGRTWFPPLVEPLSGPAPWRHRDRRTWVLVALVLLLVGALGVAGGLLLVRRFTGAPPGQLIIVRELSYRIPADWRTSPGEPGTSTAGVSLDGVASTAHYGCGGHGYHRATVGSTFLVRRDGVNARPEDAVRDFGPLFASSFYGAGATVSASAPTPLDVDRRPGSTSLVTVTPPASANCPGLVGRITVLAVSISRTGAAGGTGVLLLVIQHDTAGGPASTPPVTERTVADILASVRIAT